MDKVAVVPAASLVQPRWDIGYYIGWLLMGHEGDITILLIILGDC